MGSAVPRFFCAIVSKRPHQSANDWRLAMKCLTVASVAVIAPPDTDIGTTFERSGEELTTI